MPASIHDISTKLARRRHLLRERNNRPCPFCGKTTLRVHMMFNPEQHPGLPYSKWVHICGDCHFMGHLTGDREKDLTAPNHYDRG